VRASSVCDTQKMKLTDWLKEHKTRKQACSTKNNMCCSLLVCVPTQTLGPLIKTSSPEWYMCVLVSDGHYVARPTRRVDVIHFLSALLPMQPDKVIIKTAHEYKTQVCVLFAFILGAAPK